MKSINGYRADPNSLSSSPSHLDKPSQTTTASSPELPKLSVKDCFFTSSSCESGTSPIKHHSRPAKKLVATASRRSSQSTGKTSTSSHLPPLRPTALVNSNGLKKVSFGSTTLRVTSSQLHKTSDSQEVITQEQKSKTGSKKSKKNPIPVTRHSPGNTHTHTHTHTLTSPLLLGHR